VPLHTSAIEIRKEELFSRIGVVCEDIRIGEDGTYGPASQEAAASLS